MPPNLSARDIRGACMRQTFRTIAAIGGLLCAINPYGLALAKKPGEILRTPRGDSPASMSTHEEAIQSTATPMMGVFNNLVLFDCGRARLSSDVSEIRLVFRIPTERPMPNIAPSRNVASTDPLSVVRYDAKDHQRSLEVMRWGLVPFRAKDIKVGFANINAKAEGIETRPAFREAFRQRCCLVPVDNFFEWVRRESRVCDCPAVPSGRTCRPIGSTLRGRADRKRAV